MNILLQIVTTRRTQLLFYQHAQFVFFFDTFVRVYKQAPMATQATVSNSAASAVVFESSVESDPAPVPCEVSDPEYWFKERLNVDMYVKRINTIISNLVAYDQHLQKLTHSDVVVWYNLTEQFRANVNQLAEKRNFLCQVCVSKYTVPQVLPCCSTPTDPKFYACQDCLNKTYHLQRKCPLCRNEEIFTEWIEGNRWVGHPPPNSNSEETMERLEFLEQMFH
jgi:hypothetical protein